MFRSFALGLLVGIGITVSFGAKAFRTPPQPLRPFKVSLNRWTIKPGKEAELLEWINYLHQRDRDSVKEMADERNYLEAMFSSPDEPDHLYWLTVTGEGGATPTKPPAHIDARHLAYMRDIIEKGSYRPLTTENVVTPDFIVAAIRHQQKQER